MNKTTPIAKNLARVTTWANGFGTWYARVHRSNSDVADQAAAQRAIVTELALREQSTDETVLAALDRLDECTTVELVSNDADGTAVYRESNPGT